MTLGSYFSHCIHKACICARTHLHYYANSPYTIFITRTHTHTHTHTHHTREHTQARTTCSDINWVLIFRLLSRSVHVHECAHTLLCTQPVHPIYHTYSTYTYSTLTLLRKWNLVHNTYIHSCTVHLYAWIQMKNIKHVYTHSHTHMYIAHKAYSAKLVLCTCTCIVFHLTALCMHFISIPCPFAPCMWSSLMAGSLYIHTIL